MTLHRKASNATLAEVHFPPASPALLRLPRIVAVLLTLALVLLSIRIAIGLSLTRDVARPPVDAGADASDSGGD